MMSAPMPELPTVEELIRDIRDAFDEVEKLSNPQQNGGWTNVICEAITRRVGKRKCVECSFGRTRLKPCDEREWLFNYCALFSNRRKTSDVLSCKLSSSVRLSSPT